MHNNEEIIDICKSVQSWWNEHKYDTCGDYGDYMVYDDPPEFVILAFMYLNKYGISCQP